MYDNITFWYNSNLTSYLNMFVNLSLTSDDIDDRERERERERERGRRVNQIYSEYL